MINQCDVLIREGHIMICIGTMGSDNAGRDITTLRFLGGPYINSLTYGHGYEWLQSYKHYKKLIENLEWS